jgi:hypothetical protein
MHFCTRDPNLTRAEPGLGVGFIFHPQVHPNPKKTRTPKETQKNPKKFETRKKPEKNLKETHLQKPTGSQT